MASTPVSDSRSHGVEQIARAAEVLSGSENRIRVFEEIYRGQKQVKTRSELEKSTGLSNIRVLDFGRFLVNHGLVAPEKVGRETAFRKDDFIASNKTKIIRLARAPKKLAAQPRSTQVRGSSAPSHITITVAARPSFKPPMQLTIDEIESFSEVNGVSSDKNRVSVSEEYVKLGIQKIIGEAGEFKDWGGEVNDISSSRLRIAGARRQAAMALKGPAQKGKLTPGKMGKNGDQIQRLFSVDAFIYILQYVGQIDDSVRTQMHALALARAASQGKLVRFCLIDGQDTDRLMKAYPKEFAGV